MPKVNIIPISAMRYYLNYDPVTGAITWIRRGSRSTKVGVEAGWIQPVRDLAYRVFQFKGRNYLSHRVGWAMHYDKQPPMQIDHINGDGCDNRITNLRQADYVINGRNHKMHKNNKTGVLGVRWDSDRKKWKAYIGAGGRQRMLGRYEKFEDAVKVRTEAEIDYGYHANHGLTAKERSA